MDRRDFIRKSAMAGAVLSMPAGMFARGIAKEKVRIGFIGVGLRGCNHLRNVLMRDDVEVPAICDIDPERLDVAAGIIAEAGAPKARHTRAANMPTGICFRAAISTASSLPPPGSGTPKWRSMR